MVRLLTVNVKNESVLPGAGSWSYPKNREMRDPILVTLLKMPPHYSQSTLKNATPCSVTSLLASYKEVTPPGLPCYVG